MKPYLLFRHSSILLLFTQIFLITSSAWWSNDPNDRPWLTVTFTLLFCATGYTLARSKYWLYTYIPLSLAAIVSSFHSQDAIQSWIHSFAIMGIQCMLFFAVMKHSFFKKNVTRTDRIVAGVTGYILIGLFWNTQLLLLTSLGSEPLLNQVTLETPNLSDNIYFTFVSLTTLGYGDIIPITPAAKVISIFISLTGTLYLAVFISSLISSAKK